MSLNNILLSNQTDTLDLDSLFLSNDITHSILDFVKDLNSKPNLEPYSTNVTNSENNYKLAIQKDKRQTKKKALKKAICIMYKIYVDKFKSELSKIIYNINKGNTYQLELYNIDTSVEDINVDNFNFSVYKILDSVSFQTKLYSYFLKRLPNCIINFLPDDFQTTFNVSFNLKNKASLSEILQEINNDILIECVNTFHVSYETILSNLKNNCMSNLSITIQSNKLESLKDYNFNLSNFIDSIMTLKNQEKICSLFTKDLPSNCKVYISPGLNGTVLNSTFTFCLYFVLQTN